MTIDIAPDNVTDIATARPAPDPLPLIDPAKAAKLRAIIQAKTDAEREAERLRQRIAVLEHEPIDGRDPRMRHIWIQAARKAIEDEHCEEYDRIVEEVGGETRDELRDAGELDRSYRVRTHVTVEVYLSIEAADAGAALSRIDDLDSGDLRDLLRNEVGSVVDDLSLESWDARDADIDG